MTNTKVLEELKQLSNECREEVKQLENECLELSRGYSDYCIHLTTILGDNYSWKMAKELGIDETECSDMIFIKFIVDELILHPCKYSAINKMLNKRTK